MFGGNAGNMAGMMKKVQKMQADMAKLQEELKQRSLLLKAAREAKWQGQLDKVFDQLLAY